MTRPTAAAALLAATLCYLPVAAQDFDSVQIETRKVAPGIYMLEGRGGNIGVSVGEDGILLIDDQYAPLTDKIRAALATISDKPVRFVLNTHWHGDHTGGNENFGKLGSLVVAHENVRQRMSVEQFMKAIDQRVPPSPEGALPVVTFTEAVTFHLNDEEIHAFHVAAAHTDGDAMVEFRKANVLHMGDVFWSAGYPFIDVSSGGSVDGMITAVESTLERIDAETRVIAGHGPLAGRADVVAYRDMLRGIRDRVAALIAEGKALDEILAAKPSAAYDERWGGWFVKPDRMVTSVYDSLPH